MSPIVLLHIGDDASLRASRTAILREDFDVHESSSRGAWDAFMNGDFDGVVMCGSIPIGTQRALAQRIREYSPSIMIAQMGEFQNRDMEGVTFVSPFAPEEINGTLLAVLSRRGPMLSKSSKRSATG